ncbi:3TM-type holin [Ferrovibrio sp.]|uniref:3TM-type holin n=1 Tax=Ferrovibrio sp. TaxID=1917215 RepID=UPI002626CFC6|nr:3TM-type holin [Ferrovibrio sp.]
MLDKLLVANIASPIEAIGNVFDKLFTSDAERAQAEAVLEKLRQYPAALQVELNKIEAAHRSVFVAGWRPAVGWICAAGVGWAYLGHPLFLWAAALWAPGVQPPEIQIDSLFELVLAMLGMAGLRSFEKTTGRAK